MPLGKKFLIVSIIVVGSATGLWRFSMRTVHAQSPDRATEARRALWGVIEDKAQAAESGDPDSVRALADAIFDQPHILGTLPAFIRTPVEERLIHAEMDYRNGDGRGVTHADVARTTNWLADKFGLPDYARTSEHQILVMRFWILGVNPKFMGKGLVMDEDGTPIKVGGSVNPTMSPLQACYLLMNAVDEKLMNPDYQMAPEAWEAHRYQESLQEWERYRQMKAVERREAAEGKRVVVKGKLTAVSTSKPGDLIRAIQARAEKMSLAEWMSMAQSTLDTLGIERLP